MNKQEAFQTLGISPTSSEAEIKKAYRKLAAKHHPDKGGAEEDFKRVKLAYEYLTEPEKFSQHHERTYRTNNADAMEEFLRRYNSGTTHTNRGPFDGFFNDNQRQRNTSNQSRLFNGQVDITLEDAFKGTTYPFTIPGCVASTVTIEPGIRPSSKIQVHSKSVNDDTIHVAIIEVKLLPHSQFELDGNDLRVSLTRPLIDFYIGATLLVPSIEGSSIQVKLPPNSQPNTILRLKGKGYNSNKTRGNMYVTVKVELPKLNEIQIEKLKEILI